MSISSPPKSAVAIVSPAPTQNNATALAGPGRRSFLVLGFRSKGSLPTTLTHSEDQAAYLIETIRSRSLELFASKSVGRPIDIGGPENNLEPVTQQYCDREHINAVITIEVTRLSGFPQEPHTGLSASISVEDCDGSAIFSSMFHGMDATDASAEAIYGDALASMSRDIDLQAGRLVIKVRPRENNINPTGR